MRYGIRNYRCFSGDKFVEIDLDSKFVSFVGQNNAGKSALLRSIYELRNFFSLLGHQSDGYLAGSQGTKAREFDPFSTQDPRDLFSDANDEDLEVRFYFDSEDPAPGDPRVVPKTITWSVNRNSKIHRCLVDIGDGEQAQTAGWISLGSGGRRALQLNSGARCNLDALMPIAARLANSFYLGASRNALDSGEGAKYFDLQVGQQFLRRWNSLKTGRLKSERITAREIERKLADVFGFQSLEVNINADGDSLLVVADNSSLRLDEVGSGFTQFLVVMAYVADRRPDTVLIDEPEANLHPALQTQFLDEVGSIADYVMFSTHSVGLARTQSDARYLVKRRAQGKSTVESWDSARNLSEMLGELSFAGYQDVGYDGVLLVEGTADVRPLRSFLSRLDLEHRLVVVPLGGSNAIREGVEAELRELLRLTSNLFALIDSERKSAGESPEAGHSAFKLACDATGVKCKMTEKRALENYFTAGALESVFGAASKPIEDFETVDEWNRRCGLSWGKSAHNWKIASAMQLCDFEETDLGQFLNEVKVALT